MPQQSILIVDDDDFYRNLFLNKFREEGFHVVAAVDGLAAWGELMNAVPDAIMTGILMPNLDGFSLIERVRADARFRRMKVFVLSHYGREEDRKRADELRVDGFFTMGYTPFPEIIMRMEASLKTFPSFRFRVHPDQLDSESRASLEELRKSLACRVCKAPYILTLEADSKRPLGEFLTHVACPDCDTS